MFLKSPHGQAIVDTSMVQGSYPNTAETEAGVRLACILGKCVYSPMNHASISMISRISSGTTGPVGTSAAKSARIMGTSAACNGYTSLIPMMGSKDCRERESY